MHQTSYWLAALWILSLGWIRASGLASRSRSHHTHHYRPTMTTEGAIKFVKGYNKSTDTIPVAQRIKEFWPTKRPLPYWKRTEYGWARGLARKNPEENRFRTPTLDHSVNVLMDRGLEPPETNSRIDTHYEFEDVIYSSDGSSRRSSDL